MPRFELAIYALIFLVTLGVLYEVWPVIQMARVHVPIANCADC